MKSIAYELAYRYALLLRLDSPVLRDHDRGLPWRTPHLTRSKDRVQVLREGVVIIAATRGQQHLGDKGLGHGPAPSGPRSPFGATVARRGQVRAQRQSMVPWAPT